MIFYIYFIYIDNERKSAIKPEGRLTKLGDITLVDTDEPLYIPRTQDPVPKTEDQLEDDAEVMLKLGPGSGTHTYIFVITFLYRLKFNVIL